MKEIFGIVLVSTMVGLNIYARRWKKNYEHYILGLDDSRSGEEQRDMTGWKDSWKKHYLRGYNEGKDKNKS